MTEPSQRDMAEGVLTKHMPGVAKAVEDVLNKGKRVEISIVTDRKKNSNNGLLGGQSPVKRCTKANR